MDPVFAKTSPKRSFSVIENECFELVFAKTGSINSGTGLALLKIPSSDCFYVNYSCKYETVSKYFPNMFSSYVLCKEPEPFQYFIFVLLV
jgi:hypothetical protein